MNKLAKGNLVRGLPSKVFKNNHTCVACEKGKQHKASCKSKPVSLISQPLQRLHMDLFGPTFVKSLNKKSYYLVVTDDYSRFSWVFFLATKDETSGILKTFITGIEKQINHKELLLGRSPGIGFMRPFGCLVTILNILDPLGKFNGKADEGFLVGYYVNSKAFRVFNRIEPKWLFDIDTLTMSMNYQPVVAGNQPTDNADKVWKETVYAQQYVLLPLWSLDSQDPKNTDANVANDAFKVKETENDVHVSANESDKTDKKKHDEKAKRDDKEKSLVHSLKGVMDLRAEFDEFFFNSTNKLNAFREPVNVVGPNPTNSINSFNTASPSVNDVSPNFGITGLSSFVDPSKYPDDPDMSELEDIVYSDDEEDVGAEAGLSNMKTNIHVSPILTTRVYKDHPVNQIIGDLNSAPQTKSMTRMKNPRKYSKHSKIQVGLNLCKKSFYNLNCKRFGYWSIDLRGHTQEEGIDYDEVFAPVARIEAIRFFLAYASFIGFEDPDYTDKVYKVVKALYRLHQAPIAWYETLANYLLENGFQRGKIDQTLFIKKQK
nr:ribonuclease H-like domain-containing protein [Tanacetum cinerariifolium]